MLTLSFLSFNFDSALDLESLLLDSFEWVLAFDSLLCEWSRFLLWFWWFDEAPFCFKTSSLPSMENRFRLMPLVGETLAFESVLVVLFNSPPARDFLFNKWVVPVVDLAPLFDSLLVSVALALLLLSFGSFLPVTGVNDNELVDWFFTLFLLAFVRPTLTLVLLLLLLVELELLPVELDCLLDLAVVDGVDESAAAALIAIRSVVDVKYLNAGMRFMSGLFIFKLWYLQ